MSRTITIAPVTRIEGHLTAKAEVGQDGRVHKAYLAGTSFRDFENILVGRRPWDAVHLTQRICGVCPVSHAIASAKAAEQAAAFTPSDQALLIRAIMQAAYFVSDHVLHFYQLSLLDYITGPRIPPLGPAYTVDMRFDAAQTEALVGNYLEALRVRRLGQEMVAVLAGRMPHVMSVVPGGVTQSPSRDQVDQLATRLALVKAFVRDRYLQDAYLLAETYRDYFGIGKGCGNLICYEAFGLPGGKSIFAGRHSTGHALPQSLPIDEIREFVRFAFYSSPSGVGPAEGATVPCHPKERAYSWIKAPRLRGRAHETGPLARMKLNGLYLGSVSVMDRILARAQEAAMLVELLSDWIAQVEPGAETHVDLRLPPSGTGVGITEAPRGALGHWLQYAGGSISRYQIITPTCWNASPADDQGGAGPMEQALTGVSVARAEEPIELLRIVHSFDPCLSCAVHALEV
jgi:hydrogenase large subunit